MLNSIVRTPQAVQGTFFFFFFFFKHSYKVTGDIDRIEKIIQAYRQALSFALWAGPEEILTVYGGNSKCKMNNNINGKLPVFVSALEKPGIKANREEASCKNL